MVRVLHTLLGVGHVAAVGVLIFYAWLVVGALVRAFAWKKGRPR